MKRLGAFSSIVLCLLLAACAAGGAGATGEADAPRKDFTVDVVAARGATTPLAGYTLFHPLKSKSVYLVDMNGELVHRWQTALNPGHAVYLLPNGNLLRASRDPEPEGSFHGGGEGGIIQEIAWDGTVVWNFRFSDASKRHHHDVEPLPNGNVLVIAWESRSYEEALQAGINPARMTDDYIWPDFIVEVQPVRPDGGDIVWEWHVWDHLVQELYRDKDNYGVVAEHPELIDINAAPSHRARQEIATPESVARLRALGYIAGNAESDNRAEIRADWTHVNAIDYNAELDQILLSSRNFSEIWIIDHSTTTAEAAGHSGGRYGRGGDLLYRWGNPEAWGAGGPEDRGLYVQHDPRWIEPGLPGAGNILIFNNGAGRPDLNYSSVLEIAPPLESDGSYDARSAATLVWEYTAPRPQDMYSGLLGGAQRLLNGNTLIAVGVAGKIVEVGAGNTVVWEFDSPYDENEDRGAAERFAGIFGVEGVLGGDATGYIPRVGSIYRATRFTGDDPALAALRAGPDQR